MDVWRVLRTINTSIFGFFALFQNVACVREIIQPSPPRFLPRYINSFYSHSLALAGPCEPWLLGGSCCGQ